MPDTDDLRLVANLESAKPAQKAVAIRLRRLAAELFGFVQKNLHDAMGGEEVVRRTELTTAWNGGSLCGTDRWTKAIADAVTVSWPVARAYLDGKIELEELLASRGKSEVIVPDNLERVLTIAAKLGKSAAEALDVASGLRAYKGSITDEEIAARFAPARASKTKATVVDLDDLDDLGGGISAVPKQASRKRK